MRDGIEAERNLQGFFMAYLYLSSYYIIAPELELSHGPSLTINSDSVNAVEVNLNFKSLKNRKTI